MKIKKLLKIIATSSVTVTIILALIIIALTKSQFDLNRISEFAYNSRQASEDIRRHSEYMQNLCRNYLITGDPWWAEQYYQEYSTWNGLIPLSDGRTVFWLDSYTEAGFTPREFALLQKHNDKRQFVIEIERRVLEAAEAYFSAEEGMRSVAAENEYNDAVKTLFGDTYRAYFQIALNPLEDFIILIEDRSQEQLELSKRKTEILMFVTILFSFIGILWQIMLVHQLQKRILNPLIHLQKVFHGAVDAGLSERAEAFHDDEMGDLYACYNAMITKIKIAMEQVVVEQKNRRKAELRIMQSQINPHFLYNTLDTIVWMAEIDEHSKVVELATSLSSFFRISLSRGMEKISLNDELQHVENYLSIQHIRYEDTIQYEIRRERLEYDSHIPKLIIQPFLENAIYHGLKMKRCKGKLVLTVGGGKNIDITISDNGAGIEKTVLEGLRKMISGEKRAEDVNSFGIANTLERLRYQYGDRLFVNIDSEPGIGTTVKISFPGGSNV